MTTTKASPQQPTALSLDSAISFLNYILDHHNSATTLIVCSTHEDFLQHLHASLHRRAASPPSSPPSSNSPPSQSATPPATQQAPPRLLHPTLQNFALTSRITLVFTPTLQHLRAYLTTYTSTSPSPFDAHSTIVSPQPLQTTTLAILNLLSLHRSTPHFSAQGLSRTFASAVEAAYRAEARLVVCECPDIERYGGGEEEGGGGVAWEERVPLLNETIRFAAGAGAEGRGWAGRSVSCRRVAERWFAFGDGDRGVR